MSLTRWNIEETSLMSLVDGVSDLWTRSPGTYEFYYNQPLPHLIPPSFLVIDGVNTYAQEVGALEPWKWGWGNNDGLDSERFYLRLPLKTLSDGGSTDLWTISGSGVNEYYYTGPEMEKPDGVVLDGSEVTEGTPGSLSQGQWGYGDNDSLGYSTIYVRLSDDTDPDTKAADWVQGIIDPDTKPADFVVAPQPHIAVQKQEYTECIILSMLVSNPSMVDDARVWIYIADKDENVLFKWFVDLPMDSSPFALDTKQVLADQDRLEVMSNQKDVCVLVSGDEE